MDLFYENGYLLTDLIIHYRLDYEVAELTWENGQIAMHGLGPPRVPNKLLTNTTSTTTTTPTTNSHPCKYTTATATTAWEKPRAGGTLESIVNQATRSSFPHKPPSSANAELVPWFDHHLNAAAAAMTTNMDAQVPCSNRHHHHNDVVSRPPSARAGGGGVNIGSLYTQVASCSGAATRDDNNNAAAGQQMKRAREAARVPPEWSVSGTSGSHQVTMDQYSCERDFGVGFMTSTSLGSLENASSGKPSTKAATATTTAADDHDSVCHSRLQASDH